MTRIHYSERPHAQPNYASRTQLARLDSPNIATDMHDGDKKFNQHRAKWGYNSCLLRSPLEMQEWRTPSMKTGLAILLAALFISGVFVTQGAMAADEKQGVKDAAASAKETRWQGHIVRIDKDR